jgi:hypothetical protein
VMTDSADPHLKLVPQIETQNLSPDAADSK